MVKDNVKLPDYSVLMSVYAGEKPEFFKQSVESMLNQTYPTSDFVLVCDGQLTKELEELVSYFEENYECFHPVRLKEKLGTGPCANKGIEMCRNEYIVKMDSDDIAMPDRCEKSLYTMAKHGKIDMLGAYIEEFDSDSNEIVAVKKTPIKYEDICIYARRRNPFNNQTLVYKKTAAVNCGGYSQVKRCEDYDFVVKMLASGAFGVNLPEVLVRYRITRNNLKRRRNWANTKSFISVRWRIYKSGFSRLSDFIVPCMGQLLIFILPNGLTGKFYKRFLRD